VEVEVADHVEEHEPEPGHAGARHDPLQRDGRPEELAHQRLLLGSTGKRLRHPIARCRHCELAHASPSGAEPGVARTLPITLLACESELTMHQISTWGIGGADGPRARSGV